MHLTRVEDRRSNRPRVNLAWPRVFRIIVKDLGRIRRAGFVRGQYVMIEIVPDIRNLESESSRITSSGYLSGLPHHLLSPRHPSSTCLPIYLSRSPLFSSELLFAFSLPHTRRHPRCVRTMIYGFKVPSRSRPSTARRGPLSSSGKNCSAGSS